MGTFLMGVESCRDAVGNRATPSSWLVASSTTTQWTPHFQREATRARAVAARDPKKDRQSHPSSVRASGEHTPGSIRLMRVLFPPKPPAAAGRAEHLSGRARASPLSWPVAGLWPVVCYVSRSSVPGP
ncbi:hypothetical protein D187_003077 [Cystobacter fuscus DSM 2262]|uniref:Uncharacterized protein n=1 Tax=Cystobacter fuscus (strain ATCC 25194 / DSM 2262 / NBRC 100088 / M29) TaxID=1242864 RepID=S9QRE7_CYSF2|nr:hypothetical protein D187_003077 [Cystobacter fuscus DSM 2262]